MVQLEKQRYFIYTTSVRSGGKLVYVSAVKINYHIDSNNYIKYVCLIHALSSFRHELKIFKPDEWLKTSSLLNETSNIFEIILSQKN